MMPPEVLAYQFDDVIVDIRAGRVVKGGLVVPLEPKAFDLLVLLTSRSGELVTRQEILDRVWAGVFVTDNAVARVVAQIRRALGDSPRDARYIETVPTRGYRFIGRVIRQTEAAPAEARPAPPGPADTPAPPAEPSHPWIAAGLVLVALMALALAWRASQSPDASVSQPRRTQLTSSAALDAFPAWSPDGQTLAYASDRGGRFELYLHDLSHGGDRLALTTDGQHNVQPAWSPDGTQLAYHSSGRGGIWVVSREGGTPRQVSPFGSRPAWSPDGALLAFQEAPYSDPGASSVGPHQPSTVWVVAASGGEPRRVTEPDHPRGAHTRPTWFPDSRRLLFAVHGVETSALWAVDVRTGVSTRVTDDGPRTLDPVLSPDGKAVYYVRQGTYFDLWRQPLSEAGLRGGPAELVVPPGELDIRHVTVHPDDGRLAYVAMQAVSGLRVLPVNREGVPTGPSTQLTEHTNRGAHRPSWSEDGREVLYEIGRDTERQLHAVDVQSRVTRLVRRLGAGEPPATQASTSPDGRFQVFPAMRDGQWNVWIAATDRTRQEQLTRYVDEHHLVGHPTWSPTGDRVAYEYATFTGNIWVLSERKPAISQDF